MVAPMIRFLLRSSYRVLRRLMGRGTEKSKQGVFDSVHNMKFILNKMTNFVMLIKFLQTDVILSCHTFKFSKKIKNKKHTFKFNC